MTEAEVIEQLEILEEMREAEIDDLTEELSQMSDKELETIVKKRASAPTTKSRIASEILNKRHNEVKITYKTHPAHLQARQLPIYDLAVKRYPHLVHVNDALQFCNQLCILAAVPGISILDYFKIARVADGEPWKED